MLWWFPVTVMIYGYSDFIFTASPTFSWSQPNPKTYWHPSECEPWPQSGPLAESSPERGNHFGAVSASQRLCACDLMPLHSTHSSTSLTRSVELGFSRSIKLPTCSRSRGSFPASWRTNMVPVWDPTATPTANSQLKSLTRLTNP